MKLHKFDIIIPPQDLEHHPDCLEKVAAGDRSGYEWLYKNYSGKLYNYLLLLTGDKGLSEDLVQDAFIKIWHHKESLGCIKHFNSYLYTTARNLLLDRRRRMQLEKEYIKNFNALQAEQNLFYRRSGEQVVNAAIKTLSPRQELVYRMIREEGQTREEVSKRLKISPNTVKGTMQKALAGLKGVVGRRFGIKNSA